ncbi:MAG: Maf-like protein [Muribaculaceae bacterium]|nr:Maf-like protein [Muribaculaceae bacterium]
MLHNLKDYKIILASKSPRRQELLSQLGLQFETFTISGIDETYPPGLSAEEVPCYLAELKGNAYLKELTGNSLIITADTLVILDNEILGKPKDRASAIGMLQKLSGKTHQVITGVCISSRSKRISFYTETKVRFAQISEEDIEFYVDNFHPYDKAGAYGIQEWIGCVAVEGIEGSFYNVMGLPVHQLYKELTSF